MLAGMGASVDVFRMVIISLFMSILSALPKLLLHGGILRFHFLWPWMQINLIALYGKIQSNLHAIHSILRLPKFNCIGSIISSGPQHCLSVLLLNVNLY